MKFYTNNISACVALVESSKADVTMIKKDFTEVKMSDYFKELKKKKEDKLTSGEAHHLKRLKRIFG